MASASVLSYLDEDEKCRHCHSPSLHVDWAAGDRVCTNCGVVNEEHLRDDRPEWREFNDDNDLAKGGAAKGRCGAIIDENRHVGGLEPTALSKQVFGGSTQSESAHSGLLHRKKLIRASRRIDLIMARQNANALKEAKISRQLRKRRLKITNHNHMDTETDFTEEEEDDTCALPEHEQLLIQEEEDAHRAHAALNADKWSLDRAIILHGRDDEQQAKSFDSHRHFDREAERSDLLQRMDGSMRRASSDLYRAYDMLNCAAQKLNLPDRAMHEAAGMLCKYAARKNGFFVKGVSSRLSSNKDNSAADGNAKKKPNREEKEALERLREFNKAKQMASLGSSLLVLTARNLGWARPISEVCSSFQMNVQQTPEPNNAAEMSGGFIKPKHCSKAITEVKTLFPEYVRSPAFLQKSTNNVDAGALSNISAGNFVDHATRKLDLPPVALAAIRALVIHCRKEQVEKGTESGTRLSTLCAGMTYFVCMAGATMQKLAQHAQSSKLTLSAVPSISSGFDRPAKKQKTVNVLVKHEKLEVLTPATTPCVDAGNDSFDGEGSSVVSDSSSSSTGSDIKQEKFDVFSHAPLADPEAKQEYEARRIWDAWTEQMPWSRNVGIIEQSYGVSRNVILDHYKKSLHPKRQDLLQVLQQIVTDDSKAIDSEARSVRDAPLSSVLLSNITSAAAILSSKVN